MDIKKYLIVVIIFVLVLIGLTMLFEGNEPDHSIDVPPIPLIIL